MASTFEQAVEIILECEGGPLLTDDPQDRGGETRWGVSKAAHPDVDIVNLTRDGAIALYRAEYWLTCSCDKMSWPWALAVFDCAVNQGVDRARHLAQQAAGVTVDGVIGPATLAALSDRGLDDFFARRAMLYATNSQLAVYGHGWMRRLFVVHGQALQPQLV